MSMYVNQTAQPGAAHVSSEQSREELMIAHWNRSLFSWSTYGILQNRKVVPSQITSVPRMLIQDISFIQQSWECCVLHTPDSRSFPLWELTLLPKYESLGGKSLKNILFTSLLFKAKDVI